MTKEEVLKHLCKTVSLVYHSIGDYNYASDGFCEDCPAIKYPDLFDFRHEGVTLEYVREAVIEQMVRDGYKIKEGPDEMSLSFPKKELVEDSCRRGWRIFHCEGCGRHYEQASRDAKSGSEDVCPICGETNHPTGFRIDPSLECDLLGNLKDSPIILRTGKKGGPSRPRPNR